MRNGNSLDQDVCSYRLEHFRGKYYSPTCLAVKKCLAHIAGEDSTRPFLIYDRVENFHLIQMTSDLLRTRLRDKGIDRNVILLPRLDIGTVAPEQPPGIPVGVWAVCVCQ